MSDPNRPPAPPPDGGITVSNPATRVARGPQADAQRIAFPAPVFRELAADAASPADGAAADGAPGRRRVAVLVCHGMGQQVPFENIDLIAGALEKADRERREPAKDGNERPRVRFARLGKQWLPRAEVALDAGERPTDVHVYEAYWAPLTEGRVSALDVTRFLLSAGFRGLRYALRGRFDRWIFGGPKEFRLPTGSLSALIAAFVVVVSALVLYAALGTLAALKLLGLFVADGVIAGEAQRLSAALGTGLLRSPLLVSLLLPPMAAVIWAGRVLGRALPGAKPAAREGVGTGLAALGALALGVAALAAGGPAAERMRALMDIVLPGAVDRFGLLWTGLGAVALAAAAVLALSLPLALLCRKASEKPWVSGLSVAGAILVGAWLVDAALGLVTGAAAAIRGPGAPDDPSIALGRPLFFVFVASAAYLCWVLRGLYIQYLGDVAVYLSSYTLNAFHELRGRIRQTGTEVGCAVYGARNETDTGWEYEEVLVAGHSLGSVVAYDTLNELLNEERRGGEFPVEARTRALVTFGSPLDKSAFIFRTQKEDARYREALAAAVQPLIEPVTADGAPASQGRTIPWRNIHSPFDPISGPVNYYDPPDGSPLPEHHEIVDNQPDRRACVFGAAHVSYWENPLLVDWLHAQLTTARK
ncbi:MAG TPA: hypothetical protein VHG91_20110, partial [Longimicrobium sp.]|nr:hypothetical protein [Longimicrobium sp.]